MRKAWMQDNIPMKVGVMLSGLLHASKRLFNFAKLNNNFMTGAEHSDQL
jgi:hypothetical protein